MSRGLTEEQVQQFLVQIEKMLRNPSCRIEVVRGIREIPSNWPWAEYEPDGSALVTFSVSGL